MCETLYMCKTIHKWTIRHIVEQFINVCVYKFINFPYKCLKLYRDDLSNLLTKESKLENCVLKVTRTILSHSCLN